MTKISPVHPVKRITNAQRAIEHIKLELYHDSDQCWVPYNDG
jgi:hypothetical protein